MTSLLQKLHAEADRRHTAGTRHSICRPLQRRNRFLQFRSGRIALPGIIISCRFSNSRMRKGCCLINRKTYRSIRVIAHYALLSMNTLCINSVSHFSLPPPSLYNSHLFSRNYNIFHTGLSISITSIPNKSISLVFGILFKNPEYDTIH